MIIEEYDLFWTTECGGYKRERHHDYHHARMHQMDKIEHGRKNVELYKITTTIITERIDG